MSIDEKLVEMLKPLIVTEVTKAVEAINKPRQPQTDENPYFTGEDVCKLLHVTAATRINMVKRGQLKCYYLGRKVLFKKEEVYQAIDGGLTRYSHQ